jgi:hypothetical protein
VVLAVFLEAVFSGMWAAIGVGVTFHLRFARVAVGLVEALKVLEKGAVRFISVLALAVFLRALLAAVFTLHFDTPQ